MSNLFEKSKEVIQPKPSVTVESHQFLTPLKCIIELSSMLLEKLQD
jgi:hypothetical protein